jgi:hypothetical protein
MGQSNYSLEGNGTDLSKINPPDGTNMGSSGTTVSARANYMRVVPNSHFWTDLQQLIDSINFGWLNQEIGKEYILIGLQNTIKNGYKLKAKNIDVNQLNNDMFTTIEEMIEYVKTAEYNETAFYAMLLTTLKVGYNLTNGLKLERQEVYKRLDGERDYQDERWGTRRTLEGTPDEEKPVAEWINYMEFHLAKAKEKVYYLKTEEALAEIRKVSALGVRAMEIHGCPERGGTPVNGDKFGGEKPSCDTPPHSGKCDDKNCDCQK